MNSLLKFLFALLFFAAFASAQSTNGTVSDVTNAVTSAVSGQSIVSGLILLASGLMLTFFGYRLFKPTLFAVGFLLFGMIGYLLLVRFEPASGYGPNTETVLLCGSLAIGLVGAFLTLCFVKLGIAAMGALGGAVIPQTY